MKVKNMTSTRGNKIANQFIITDDNNDMTFQSYDSAIAKKIHNGLIYLDEYLPNTGGNQ